jgi:beta-galactosidase/beta-glucuronidase
MWKIQKTALLTLFIVTHTIAQSQVSFGKPELINKQWQFQLENHPDASFAGYDTSQGQTVDLPHDWSIKESLNSSLASCQGFLPGGIGWYRKILFVPQDKQNEKVYLYFEGVYNRSEVFVNGQSVGSRPNGYISFAFDITPFVQYGKENEIKVRVDHSRNADSRWYTGSGIYRNVWQFTPIRYILPSGAYLPLVPVLGIKTLKTLKTLRLLKWKRKSPMNHHQTALLS